LDMVRRDGGFGTGRELRAFRNHFGDQFQGFLACRDEFCVDAPSLHRANGSSDCLLVWQSLPFF